MHPERRPIPDRSPEALEARLRALPPPPVPTGLEARLLAAIPAARPRRPRRWAVWFGGALAAACLLAALARYGRPGPGQVPRPAGSGLAAHGVPRPEEEPHGSAAWWQARRVLDEREIPPFAWPLSETSTLRVSIAIPPDPLN
jgi:hypothetical protein